ncbi:chromogranin-A [Molossus nigricans]
MRPAAVLALLLCAGQVFALPVNSPMSKRDTEVMKCVVEVISDTLSKPSPVPVSQECFETLRGDERILSILRHQNLLKELQDLALQGAKERAHQQKKHSSFEDELSEVLEKQNDQAELKETEEMPSKDAAEKRGDSNEVEKKGHDTDRTAPLASPEPGQGSREEEDNQVPAEEEAANTHPLASLPSQKHPGPQAEQDCEGPSQGLADREKGQGSEQGQQARRGEEEEEEAEEEEKKDAEAGEKVISKEEGPTAAFKPHPSLGYKEVQRGEGWSKALAVDGARKTEAEEAQSPKGKGQRERPRQEAAAEAEAMAGPPRGALRGGESGEQQEERRSEEWEDAKRWSKMDQLAKELTAEKRLEGEEEEEGPDHSMKRPFPARGYGFRGPGLQMRGWRPPSQEDSVEPGLPLQAHSYPEEGSANRRPEDQELESLSAIEAELEKVAHQLQALQRG